MSTAEEKFAARCFREGDGYQTRTDSANGRAHSAKPDQQTRHRVEAEIAELVPPSWMWDARPNQS